MEGQAGLGFRVRSSNKGACVWRQAGAKSEVDNQSTNRCRDSGKTADATGSFMLLLVSGRVKWLLLQLPFDR